MGLGILEPDANKGAVPGTATLLVKRRTVESQSGQHAERIVPVPKPSQSPNDPLNWPLWRKDLALFILSIAQGIAGVQGVILSAATAQVAQDFRVGLFKAETLGTYQLLAVGASCAASCVCARLFGKRPVFIVSGCIELASCIWTGAGRSFNSVLGSRIFYGLGGGAFEGIVISSIGDMYFVHQRGRRIAFYNLLGLGCAQLSPILGGYLTDTYGWRIQAWILVAFWAVTALAIFFGVPESNFIRPFVLETDLRSAEKRSESGPEDTPAEEDLDTTVQVDHTRSYWQNLAPFRAIDKRPNPVKLTLRLFLCALYPAVWWTFLVVGTYIAWFIALSVVLAQIFSVPPISFTPTKIGYLNTFGFPGALVAWFLMHVLIDRSCKWLARSNNGTYEPEFRLPPMVFSLITGVIALSVFGWYTGSVAETREISWVATSFIYGLLIFAVVAAESVAFSYLLDAYRDISIEAVVFSVMARNFFSYGASTFLPLWLEASGIAHTFYGLAGIQAGLVTIGTMLIYFFGKRIRSFYDRHSPMEMFHAGVTHRNQY